MLHWTMKDSENQASRKFDATLTQIAIMSKTHIIKQANKCRNSYLKLYNEKYLRSVFL